MERSEAIFIAVGTPQGETGAADLSYVEAVVSEIARAITSYKVITVQPRGENDPDIYLVVYYKNWAALDGATAKGDAIAKEVQGSTAAANQGAVDRGKIRRVLGSWTGQQLDLK